ncbi:MAG: CDP-diacylglycerol--serine O-phosphatidyltransferase [Sphingobacteriales bacterium]|nr:MAG: CDP-diacylglycerol--serine O-phosphatidyltransferase [Sphingobacteriales bacterium]
MKHLPNLLTLANLVSGCLAIVFVLNSQPFLTQYGDGAYWVTGTEQAYYASICILVSAVCDVLDGFVARKLNIFSPIGKDLDSLADMVSFGVAPSMILFKMLWASQMTSQDALDANMLAMAPAFLIACCGALRLARFNITANVQRNSFMGMPIPATGLLIASFPLINWYNPMGIGAFLQNAWILYVIIGLLSWLMVSKIRFIKLIPSNFSVKHIWPQIVLLIAGVALAPIAGWATVLFVFVLYMVLSLVYKPQENKIEE